MSGVLASEFEEIQSVLAQNKPLQTRVLDLINTEPIPGKATEGDNRILALRQVLRELVQNQLTLVQAYARVSNDLPTYESSHRNNAHVFADRWEERLVRVQLSRFYNQAVMEMLLEEGESQCFVPNSSSEKADSLCSRTLAGEKHDLRMLYDRLIDAYHHGNFTRTAKIPNHPYCTHVVKPVE